MTSLGDVIRRIVVLVIAAALVTLAGATHLDWASADDGAVTADDPAAVDATPVAEDAMDGSLDAEVVATVEDAASPVAEPPLDGDPGTTDDPDGGDGATDTPTDAVTVTPTAGDPSDPAAMDDATPTEVPPGDGPSSSEVDASQGDLGWPSLAEQVGDGSGVAVSSLALPGVSGDTSITPDNAQAVAAGTVATYTHLVQHLRPGNGNDVKNITAVSSRGWAVALFKADGVTPLPDTNGDGIPDSGKVTRGKSATIVVKVTVPANATATQPDVTTVTATSVDHPNEAAFATDTTTVLPTLTLTINTGAVSYGSVSPVGGVDPAAVGVTSQVDGTGATYVAGGAVHVTVISNANWSGSCQAAENTGSASAIAIAGGRLKWRFTGGSAWTAFTITSPSPPLGNGCLPNPAPGVNNYNYDYGLRVEWTDQPGSFNSVVTYVAVA
jgi:hypothetical protein